MNPWNSQAFRNEFRLPKVLYFNSANLSIPPERVLASIDYYRRDFETNPTQNLSLVWRRLWQVQSHLASFLGAKPGELFLRANTSEVMNTFILGCELPAHSEILMGEHEYGAVVNMVRHRCERDRLAMRILKMPASRSHFKKLTAEHWLELCVSQLTEKTRMLVMSHILPGTGLQIPLTDLAQETRKRGIALVVDGAYGPGALNIDFSRLGNVDYYACPLYKWLLGPKGTAFGWVNPLAQENLKPILAGWTTYEGANPIRDFVSDPDFAFRFLFPGCRDFSPFLAIEDTLRFWESYGFEPIRDHLLQNTAALDGLVGEKLGWRRLYCSDAGLNSPLLVYSLPHDYQIRGEGLADFFLRKLGVQLNSVNLRGIWHTILSVHAYNSTEEFEEFIFRVKKLP